MQFGDTIVGVGPEDTVDSAAVTEIVYASASGDALELAVVRGNDSGTITVQVEER